MLAGACITTAPLGWGEVFETLLLRSGHNTRVLVLVTTLLVLAAGVAGVFALLRKRALMTDALSHATLPGIALAFLFATALGLNARALPLLLLGATITGVLSVLCIQGILRSTRLKEDAAIGIVLSVFFGAGIVGLSYIQASPGAGNAAGLNALIYGQTAGMSGADAGLMAAIALLCVLGTLLLLKEFALICFNDGFARADGWPVSVVDLLMMAMVVLVTVAGLRAVGLILVVAMLIIPPVAARFWTERLAHLVLLSGLLGAMSGYLGAVLSSLLAGYPAGAVIVLTSGALFVISMLVAPARGVIAISARRASLRLRIAGEHLLEFASERGMTNDLDDRALARLAQLRGWSALTRRAVITALRLRGDLTRRGDRLVLTAEGAARGARIRRNHTLWEHYLVRYADVAPSHVDWSVDQVEHVLCDELIAELESELAMQGVQTPVGAQ